MPPETIDPQILAERERCARSLEMSSSDIRLLAGELTPNEMRAVQAVLRNRAAVIRNPSLDIAHKTTTTTEDAVQALLPALQFLLETESIQGPKSVIEDVRRGYDLLRQSKGF